MVSGVPHPHPFFWLKTTNPALFYFCWGCLHPVPRHSGLRVQIFPVVLMALTSLQPLFTEIRRGKKITPYSS